MMFWSWLVSHFPFEWAQYGFMQNALLAVLLVAPIFALLGCLVVTNHMAFFSDAIGHAALTGIAIGSLLGMQDPLWAMIGFSILLALAMSVMRRMHAASTDTIISLIMAFTVALGVVLLSRGGGFSRYARFLVGDILTITPAELTRLAVLLALVLAIWVFTFNRLFLVSVNASLARSRGLNVWAIELFFAAVVAVVVTVAIPWVGLLVINSLLILPASTARNVTRNMPAYVGVAVVVSLLSGVGGLLASYYWGTASGATMVLFAMGFFAISLMFRRR